MNRLLILLPFVAAIVSGLPFSGHREDINAVARLSNQLAVDIHKKLSAQDGNVFFSPLSISTALAMLFYGTRGESAEEMRSVLGYKAESLTDEQVHSSFQSLLEAFDEESSKEYLLYIANAVLTQKNYPILPEYKDGLQNIYKATARDLDFAQEGAKAVQEINNWVKQKTNNQIDKLLDNLDASTIMVLLNAVYFKGTWKTKFDPKNTWDMPFFNKGLRSQKKNVPVMRLTEELPYADVGGFQVLELPYKGEDISMVILLPREVDGLSHLEQQLEPTLLKDLKERMGRTKVHVSLPKFKLEYQKTLNGVLQDLGMKEIFKSSADLSGISDSRMAVSEVVHKAVVEVNEEGSEASAITGVIVNRIRPMLPEPYFVADHPFMFAIVDKRSDMILFQGRVNEL